MGIPDKTKKVAAYIPADAADTLQRLADEDGRSLSNYLKLRLTEIARQEERKRRKRR